MDAQKQVTVKVGSDTKQTKPQKKATKPACDVNKGKTMKQLRSCKNELNWQT